VIARPALAGLAAVAILVACAGPAGPAATGPSDSPPREVALRNPGFEADPIPGSHCAPQWECSAHSDPFSYAYVIDESAPSAGKRSLRIERVRNEPWGLITQAITDPKLRGAKLRFSMNVRTEGATGEGGGPYFFAHGRGGLRVGHEQRVVNGTTGWQRMTMEFRVPAATEVFEVGACQFGPGRVWIDDARLEVLELAPGTKTPV
jgi:hypothetical protein